MLGLALGLTFGLVPSLTPVEAQARDWLVPEQAPTIQAAVDSCVSGDVVVISPGLYNDCTNLSENVYHIAVLKSGVSMRGSTGNASDVILDAEGNGRCLEMRGLTGLVEIEAMTLRGGRAVNPFGSGGGVFVYQSEPTFRQCVFDSNHADYAGGAICVLYGGLTVEDCVFIANETVVIGGAIRTSNSPTTITGTTIFSSIGEAIHYTGDDLTLDRCLITDGDEQAIVRNTTGDPLPTLTCTNLFGNDEDWSSFISEQADQDGNLSIDPQYCNPLFGDLTLYVTSPCAEGGNPECGLIGALPAACGTGAEVYLIRADGMGDFPTIQDGINAAANGDTLSLADGTFTGPGNRNLDYLGKSITVMGRSGDPDLAIIDCQGSLGDPQRGFHFQGEEASFSILRDITVTNGDVAGDGGAILCESSPTIINCVFRQNHAQRGAAIFCDGGSPTVRESFFTQNEGRGQAGGMAFFASEAIVRDCTFTLNWGGMGSALFLPDSSSVTVEGSTLTMNNCSLDKGMIAVDGNSRLNLDRTIISHGNHHAVRCYDQGQITLADCNVFGNLDSDYSVSIYTQKGKDGNISADPRYCDAAGGDLDIRADSPCTEVNAWNGQLIGAHDVGCEAPTWFSDISSALPTTPANSGGVSWADIDGDGHLDLFVANFMTENEVYLGDGASGFTVLESAPLELSGATVTGLWGDWNNDGDLDLYQGNSGIPNFLVSNEAGLYEFLVIEGIDHSGPAGGSTWLDFDGDGHLDLFIAATDSTSTLMHNDTEGGFIAEESFAEITTVNVQQVAAADYDNDGDLDFYLVQDGEANLMIGNEETFKDKTSSPLGNEDSGRSAAWGDFDNDENLDLYLVNEDGQNALFKNKGTGSFTDAGEGVLKDAGPGRSGIWGDWDNDGDLDLFLTNCGMADRLLRNEGDGLFVDVADPNFAAADSSTGAAWGDFDADGDLDLLVADQSGATRLYRNDQLTGHHWLEVDLIHPGGAPICHGARVRIVSGDQVQIREVSAGGGWLSWDSPTVHFGLGETTVIDTLEVTLPGCIWPIQTDVAVDQKLVLIGDEASPVIAEDLDFPGFPTGVYSCYPNPFNPKIKIRFALTQPCQAALKIYNVAGRLVQVLFDGTRPAGLQEEVWSGRDQSGRTVASGVYFVRLEAVGETDVRSVVLLR